MKDHPCIVGLGELLWDCFPDSRRAGGAPANFAFHAGQLGAEGVVASRVGVDELGEGLIEYLQKHGLNTDYVQRDATHPTGRVDVSFSPSGEPSYEFLADSAWDFLTLDERLQELASRAAAVCFGTLAQRSETARGTIHRFLDATPPDCLRIFDVNFRSPWYSAQVIEASLQRATLVKLNEHEVVEIAQMFSLPKNSPADVAQYFRDEYGIHYVIVTRGAEGCVMFSKDETIEQAGVRLDDPHPVGAGDAFTAATAVGLLRGWNLARVAQLANRTAALVASHQGAMPDVKAQLEELLGEISD